MEPLEFYQSLREVCNDNDNKRGYNFLNNKKFKNAILQKYKFSIKESNLPKLEILKKLRQGEIVYKNLNYLEQVMVSYAKFVENDGKFTTLDMYWFREEEQAERYLGKNWVAIKERKDKIRQYNHILHTEKLTDGERFSYKDRIEWEKKEITTYHRVIRANQYWIIYSKLQEIKQWEKSLYLYIYYFHDSIEATNCYNLIRKKDKIYKMI